MACSPAARSRSRWSIHITACGLLAGGQVALVAEHPDAHALLAGGQLVALGDIVLLAGDLRAFLMPPKQ